jgi:hypothetical protein
LSFRVPATVGIKFVVNCEERVTTAAFGKWGLGYNWVVFRPGLSLNIERINVAVGDSLVVETTVSSVDVDFAVIVACSGVSSGGRCTD